MSQIFIFYDIQMFCFVSIYALFIHEINFILVLFLIGVWLSGGCLDVEAIMLSGSRP